MTHRLISNRIELHVRYLWEAYNSFGSKGLIICVPDSLVQFTEGLNSHVTGRESHCVMERTHEITVIPFNVLHYFLKLPSEKNKTKPWWVKARGHGLEEVRTKKRNHMWEECERHHNIKSIEPLTNAEEPKTICSSVLPLWPPIFDRDAEIGQRCKLMNQPP